MPLAKRKRTAPTAKSKVGKKRRAEEAAGEVDVNSDAEGSANEDEPAPEADEDEEAFFETPDEKRVRLAKEYLGKLGPGGKVQEQLARDVEEQQRKAKIQVEDLKFGEPRFLKAHKRTPTCIALSSDERTVYTGGKDCAVIRMDIETGKRDLFLGSRNDFDCGGHFDEVLSICLVEQRNLMVSAGIDRVVRLWDWRAPAHSSCVFKLNGHQRSVSAVVSEVDGSQVYSASEDKSLKIWDLAARRCSDTLLGHVAGVTSMDLYQKGRVLTGGADKTVRLWKVDKDTHLMFNRHSFSVDAVAIADQDRFASAGQDGNLILWTHASKRPLASTSLGAGRWISSLGAVRGGNVLFSGAVDGQLQSWRFGRSQNGEEPAKGLKLTESVSVTAPGCINAIAVGRKLLACAVGKEHRLGRWYYSRQEKNGVLIVPMSYREA